MCQKRTFVRRNYSSLKKLYEILETHNEGNSSKQPHMASIFIQFYERKINNITRSPNAIQ